MPSRCAQNGEMTATQFLNGFGFLAIKLPRDYVRIFHDQFKVRVFHHTVKARPVAGRNLFTCRRIVNILNTVFAEHQTPIGFRFFRELRDNRFINASRLIKFAGETQPVCTRKQRQLLLIILFWNCLLRPAVFTDCDLAVFFDI